jgi:small conductance mechanosensitive channel
MIQPQNDVNQIPTRKMTPSGRLVVGVGVTLLLLLCFFYFAFPTPAQAQSGPAATPTPVIDETPPEAPNRVDVEPLARDEQISERLTSILKATGWFVDPAVQVQDGVVFLTGQTKTDEYKKWAGDLARSTQDVVAVVNQIRVLEPPIWDFQPAFARLREQWRGMVRALPLIGFSLFILLIAWVIARLGVIATRNSLHRREINPLLRNVIARAIGIFVFLIGLYVVFQVAGLTNAALTVLGGTGLLGLILGIAFRDITENFLASIFLSLQNPFCAGDLVEIAGITGFVQMLTTRTTVLMTPDGNHVQIPNATVYKSTIHNYTSNPNRRADFTVGIGYDDAIPAAQEVIMQVLAEHPAVLNDPEPLVLVDSLGSATVNLHIYFWLDGSRHSWLKVKSAIIRLVKRALQDAGVSMPDEARELIFPAAVPIQLLEADGAPLTGAAPRRRDAPQAAAEPATASTDAEGGLRSEAEEIEGQARHSRTPEDGENLLKPPADTQKSP